MQPQCQEQATQQLFGTGTSMRLTLSGLLAAPDGWLPCSAMSSGQHSKPGQQLSSSLLAMFCAQPPVRVYGFCTALAGTVWACFSCSRLQHCCQQHACRCPEHLNVQTKPDSRRM